MSPAERAHTVAVLYEWAAWCDSHEDIAFDDWDAEYVGDEAFDSALMWCEDRGMLFDHVRMHTGHAAALALCFAAAMVAAGDEA